MAARAFRQLWGFSGGFHGSFNTAFNRQTTSIILDRIGVQGDLRDRHAIRQDDSYSRCSFPTLCCVASARAGPATGVLLETSRRSGSYAAKVACQKKERYGHAKRAGSARVGSAARGKRSRSGSVLHEEGRFGCSHRPFSGRHRGEARLRGPFQISGRSAAEKRAEETSHQVLPALFGFISARRRQRQNPQEN